PQPNPRFSPGTGPRLGGPGQDQPRAAKVGGRRFPAGGRTPRRRRSDPEICNSPCNRGPAIYNRPCYGPSTAKWQFGSRAEDRARARGARWNPGGFPPYPPANPEKGAENPPPPGQPPAAQRHRQPLRPGPGPVGQRVAQPAARAAVAAHEQP